MISKHDLLVFHVEAMQLLEDFPWFDGWHHCLSTNGSINKKDTASKCSCANNQKEADVYIYPVAP